MKLSENAMIEFFSNLSMQTLLKSNNTILLNFERIEDLVSNRNNLLRIKTDLYSKNNTR